MSPLGPLNAVSPAYTLRPQPGVDGPGALGPLRPSLPTDPAAPAGSASPADSEFSNLLERMVQEVNAKQNLASDAVAALQSGQNVSLHQAVIAMEEASVSFQLMVEVRNKLLESYQELMRMQI